MRFICHDPLNATCRMLDIARKLGIELQHLALTRRGDGASVICLTLLDPSCANARLFEDRVLTLHDVTSEPTNE